MKNAKTIGSAILLIAWAAVWVWQVREQTLLARRPFPSAMAALDARDVAGLVARLKDADPGSRRIAAYGIGIVAKTTGTAATLEEAIEPLTAALTDPDPLVRRGAANGIGLIALKSGDRARFERAVRPLGEVTKDPDAFVAAHAARALERIGTPSARAIAGAYRRRENIPAEAPLVPEEGVVEAPPESE